MTSSNAPAAEAAKHKGKIYGVPDCDQLQFYTKKGYLYQWSTMTALIPDEVLDSKTLIATFCIPHQGYHVWRKPQ